MRSIAMPDAHGPYWLTDFVPFTVFHLLTVAAFGGLMLGACYFGRLWHGSVKERRLRHTWAFFVLLVALGHNAYYWVYEWSLQEGLPLQLCDLAIIVAALAMFTNSRPLRTLLYFWGIGLSTQAFFTPTLQFGIGHVKYWFFWMGHTCIVGSAVYDIVVGRYRPSLRDLGVGVGMTLAYLVVVLIANEVIPLSDAGRPANYGYVGRITPQNPTIIDKLGPWPQRVFILGGIVMVDFLLLWGIWPIGRKLTGRADPLPRREGCSNAESEG
jgi:hypothetical integral membrane protein (TIGR02206 family)